MNDRMTLLATKAELFTYFTCLRNTFSYFCLPNVVQLMFLMTENCFLPSGKECQDVAWNWCGRGSNKKRHSAGQVAMKGKRLIASTVTRTHQFIYSVEGAVQDLCNEHTKSKKCSK